MKRLLLLSVAAFALIPVCTDSTVEAAPRLRAARSNGGVFSRLMELERRKNERLRQMFLR